MSTNATADDSPYIEFHSESLLREGRRCHALALMEIIYQHPCELLRLSLLRPSREKDLDEIAGDPWERRNQAIIREEIVGAWIPDSPEPQPELESGDGWTIPFYDAAHGKMRTVSLSEVVKIDLFPFSIRQN